MTAFNSDVDVQIEVGFGSGPYATSPTWTDITSNVRTARIARGRSHQFDRVGASSLTLTVDNNSGDFDPTNTSGSYYPNVLPMVPIKVTATHSATDYGLFYGMVEAWPLDWTLGGDATVTVSAYDGIKLLNMMNTETAEAQESSGTRIGNLLDDAAWPAGWRSIATGDITVQAFTPSCVSVLSLIRQVEDTEAGLFFIDGDGNAVFQDQTHRSGATPTMTFGDSGVETKYESVKFQYDDQQVFNRIVVQRAGGASVAAENGTSISSYGERLLRVFDTLHTSDAESTTHASTLLTRLKDPHVVLESLVVNPASSGDWADVLGLELSDLVTVMRRPTAGNTIDVDVFVESIDTTITPRDSRWETVLSGTQYV